MAAGANIKLPQMTDVHNLFNPTIAPPSLVATKAVVNGVSGLPGSAGNTVRGVTRLLKRGISKNKNSRADLISLPTNFRHVVHVGSDRVEVYDPSGQADGVERKKQTFEVDLVRKNGGFGMNIKTLDNGKTVVSLVQPKGAAEELGILVNDEISHVDGEVIDGFKHEDIIARFKGRNACKLNIVRYVAIEAEGAGSSSTAPPEEDKQDGLNCRVCGKLASFNCSSCGPHITYCSVECQRSDWPTHKTECQSYKNRKTEESEPAVPATGACRVCRAKNARFRCVCGTSMYCSQECQLSDWPNHKNNCSAQEPEAGQATHDPAKLSFFAVAEKWLSKMAFVNGVFDCKWTVPLTCNNDKILIYPSCHIAGKSVVVSYADRLSSFDTESGSPNWTTNLGFPFDGSPLSIVDYDDAIIVGGVGTISAHEARSGELIWRKLLNKNLSPVTLLLRGNILFATSGEHAFCMVLDEDATLAWRSLTSTTTVPKPLSLVEGAHNSSFLAVGAEKLQLLKAFDGQMDKTRVQGESQLAVSTSVKNDIFITLRNGTLTRFNVKDLTTMWDLKIPECENCEGTLLQNTIVFLSPPGQPAATTPSDVIYVGISCRVVAVDAKDGEVKWVAKLAKPEPGVNGTVTMILLGDDVIAATNGRVFALSGNSGNPLRKAQLPQKDNPARFVTIVASDYSERTVSCLANIGSLFTRT